MKHTSKTLLAVGISLALTSCGDSDSKKHTAASSSGLAVDGYIAGAKVTCDSNRNGIADKNERVTLTDNNGEFTFSPACNYPVVISGGINKVSDTVSYPFLGNLTAPKGSSVISPLTTVQAESKLSSSQISELLGLPENTDINNTDPTKNVALYKSTLAIEQITQKLAEVFGSAPGCSTGYSEIAALIGKQLAKEAAKPVGQRKPLFKADGGVDDSLLLTMITDVNTFYGDVLTPIDIGKVKAELKIQSETFLSPLVTDLLQLQGKAIELQDPKLPPVVTTADDNYLFLKNDAFKINGQDILYTDFVNTASTQALASFGFDFELFGAPVIDSTVSIVLTLNEVGGSSRILEMMLSDVVIKNNAGRLAISIPATAQVYVYGHTSSSADANIVLNNIDPDIIHVDPLTNEATLKYSVISQRILDNTAGTELAPKFVELIDLNGTYETRLVISALNFRQANGNALPVWVAGVTNAMDSNNQPVAAITGYGWSGKLVIAPAQ